MVCQRQSQPQTFRSAMDGILWILQLRYLELSLFSACDCYVGLARGSVYLTNMCLYLFVLPTALSHFQILFCNVTKLEILSVMVSLFG